MISQQKNQKKMATLKEQRQPITKIAWNDDTAAIFSQLDSDHDMQIQEDELSNVLKILDHDHDAQIEPHEADDIIDIKDFDTNGDNNISAAELSDISDGMLTIDEDNDEAISYEEFKKARDLQFRDYDTNKNGVISRTEMKRNKIRFKNVLIRF